MPDRIVYPALLLVAAALIALALVWPQGQGAPSPPPFGHSTHAPDQVVVGRGGSMTVVRGLQSAEKPGGEPSPAHRH